MEKLRVLLLGSGGREHAMAWKITQSPLLEHLYVAPGNGGTEKIATNIDISETDFEGIKSIVLKHHIDLIIVGPEAPLVKGIREYFEEKPDLARVKLVGPGAEGAQLEGSKAFSKQFMQRHGIPTARFAEFTSSQAEQSKLFLDQLEPPYVIKADGLAAGKGVLIITDKQEATRALDEMLLGGKFGDAGNKVVIEEFLPGIELSVFVLTDGKSYVILPEAKDYKRIGEGDSGLNTGGMGSISPVPFADSTFMRKVEDNIIRPTIDGLLSEGIDYNGFLFVGLMNVNGEPMVIEYNCRMGDPETESVIPRISSDFLALMWQCGNRKLEEAKITVDPRTAACVMAVSGGYPEAYEKNKIITGDTDITESLVFHAGTKMIDGKLLSNGGRVMAFTSYGNTIKEALSKSYSSASQVHFDGIYYRKDIGFDL